MNILFIGHEDYINGASKSLLDIISLLEKDNKIYVLSSFNKGEFYDELQKHNVEVLIYPFYRWCKHKTSWKNWLKCCCKYYLYEKFANEKTARIVAKIVKDKNISIVHSNTTVINVGALIKKYCSVKHVWHIREFADIDFHMYPVIPRFLYDRIMNKYTDKFICISKAVSCHYDELDKEKKVVIYNGVDKENIISRDVKSDKIIKILIAGRISDAKGQVIAIKACERLLKEGISNFKLYLAGTGRLAYTFNDLLQEHVEILGYVKDMPNLRKKIDIELVCSVSEAFGRVTIEAMLGGIPVIGSNSGGTTELIVDGVNGCLFETGNDLDLFYKLKALIMNSNERIRMGETARKYAKDHFMIEKCVQRINDLYNSL